MKTLRYWIACPLLALATLVGPPASADPFHRDRGPGFHRGFDRGWHPHYLGIDAWHRGRWVHGYYGDRWGWWWVVAGAWYLYDAPVYPYPVTPALIEPPPVVVAPLPQPPAQQWYFCPSFNQYYPYVPQCPEGWQVVPAVPPGR